ncbi:hypothetical protein [Pseudoduganella lutea]|uniref:Uncharacterized protein n=1 Tax=Pseudoduganella lutea TaxID=321985 RepID=A0A4P6KYF3_9BURK|nr:hypothetical protein [Pseudoduganella lutea]QBE63328.1 hypothetical protein EWM63_10430 [Pseudoduganella lutea]
MANAGSRDGNVGAQRCFNVEIALAVFVVFQNTFQRMHGKLAGSGAQVPVRAISGYTAVKQAYNSARQPPLCAAPITSRYE